MARSVVPRPTLDEISIRGLGVIDSASLSFSPGFTAITGETGAGKTMVLTALGLVTGIKADSDFVRVNAERSVVSAQFSINKEIENIIEESGGISDEGCLTISRSITAEGKSRITIGGSLSTATKVQEITSYLIEIHGQSSSLRLAKPNVQRELLDGFSESYEELRNYQRLFNSYIDLGNRIKKLRKEFENSSDLAKKLREFASDFSSIMPKSGEISDIENEINRLANVEDIHLQLTTALNIIENDEGGILATLRQARKILDSLKGKDEFLDRHIEKYSNSVLDYQDVFSELVSYLTRLEADPNRFEYLQGRKQSINGLVKKYGTGADKEKAFENLILEYEEIELRLQDLDGGEERITQLEREKSEIFLELKKAAEKLTQVRTLSAIKMSEAITAELSFLSMPNAAVQVQVSAADSQDENNFHMFGIDDVTFLFSPHTGSKLSPLAKIASGGEISRLMLAIEVVLAEKSPVGIYVFDEVDAGVGGKAAVEVGRRLAMLAKNAQVIVVTHLPQVAVWADNHMVVVKDQSGSITESSVISLKRDERLKEIARMLAGQEDSQNAQKHAEELLEMVAKSVIS